MPVKEGERDSFMVADYFAVCCYIQVCSHVKNICPATNPDHAAVFDPPAKLTTAHPICLLRAGECPAYGPRLTVSDIVGTLKS